MKRPEHGGVRLLVWAQEAHDRIEAQDKRLHELETANEALTQQVDELRLLVKAAVPPKGKPRT